MPLSAPSRREFITQSNRKIGGKYRLPPFERAPYGFKEGRSPKLESLRDKPEVVEVLESTISDTKSDHRLEFFGHNGFDGIGANMWRRRVK